MSAGGSEGDIRVAVEAAGTDEAIDSIDQTEESLNEAGESMGSTADEMQGLTRRMKGLGMALAASLAVATAGLLSQVPVLGEAMGGLKAIVQGLAYQLDQLLRSMGAGGLTQAMYDLSDAIFSLEGAGGAVVGMATGLLAILAPLAAILLKTGYVIGGVISGALALAAAVGSVIGILGVLALDEMGVLDWFYNLGQSARQIYDKYVPKLTGAIDDVLGVLGDLAGWATDGVSGAFDWITDAFSDPMGAAEDVFGVLTDIGEWATSKVTDAFGWLNDALGDPLGTVEDIFETLEKIAGKTWDSVVEIVMELTDNIVGSPEEGGGGILGGAFEAGQGARDWTEGLIGGKSGGLVESGGLMNVHAGEQIVRKAEIDRDGGFSADRGDSPPVVRMDGRRLTQQDSRYRRNGTAQRGRNG